MEHRSSARYCLPEIWRVAAKLLLATNDWEFARSAEDAENAWERAARLLAFETIH
jgi:hypothetical protein